MSVVLVVSEQNASSDVHILNLNCDTFLLVVRCTTIYFEHSVMHSTIQPSDYVSLLHKIVWNVKCTS